MATLYELRSSYEKQLEEEQAIIDLRQQYKDLLTGSLTAAQQQYQQTAQTAATQARYDISGAYANYLKQQRSIAAQDRLESGYKEELSDVLKSQYGSAYQQAKATQATIASKAYETYLKSAEQAYATQTENKEIVDELVQERASRAATFADLYNQYRNITNADLLESAEYDPTTGKYPVYAMDEETGEYKLTEFGKDWYDEGFVGKVAFTDNKGETRALSFEDWLKENGDEKAIETWQTHAAEIMKDIAEIDYSKNEKGELTLPKYEEEKGKETKLKTKGYIESINKPIDSLKLEAHDYGLIDWGVKGSDKVKSAVSEMTKYGEQIGLSETDMASTLKNYIVNNQNELLKIIIGTHQYEKGTVSRIKKVFTDYINSDGTINDVVTLLDSLGSKMESEMGFWADKKAVGDVYNKLLDALQTASKTKYLGA